MNEGEILEQEIRNLECDLHASDYEVIKAYEYDMEAVHKERQAKRDRINEIQKILEGGGK